jgi:RNA-directed DNA polymerase
LACWSRLYPGLSNAHRLSPDFFFNQSSSMFNRPISVYNLSGSVASSRFLRPRLVSNSVPACSVIAFFQWPQERRAKNGKGKPETFDFLGFTHYCSRAIKNGWFKVVRKTVARRMRVQLQEVKTELRRRLHRPLPETGRWLGQIIRGHMAYYAVPDNIGSVSSFVYHVRWLWYRALCRRSQRRRMNWTRFNKICERFFPPVRIMHPQPLHRFDAKTRERSPVR